MNEIEKRRLQLLHNTRNIYREKTVTPAVHPRYRAAYRTIYGAEQEDEVRVQSTFVIRIVIAIILLVMFYAIDNHGVELHNINSQTIATEVQKNLLGQ